MNATVLLAQGFEETEAVAIVDVLRRAGVEVHTASITGSTAVMGAHGISITADMLIDDLSGCPDALVLPGGMPGATNLANDQRVLDLVKKAHAADAVVGAICAAPTVLAAAEILSGVSVTCYPGFEAQLGDAVPTSARVQVDGRIVTGRGVGTAIEFALQVVVEMGLAEVAEKLKQGMIVGNIS